MRWRRSLVPLFVLAVCAALQWHSPDAPQAARLDDEMFAADEPDPVVAEAPRTIEELQKRLASVMRREHITGMGVALVDRSGPIWVGGVGLRDAERNEPVDADTAFRVGSLSKSIIALGVMRLVDQGKLDIDRPLREVLPDFKIDNPWEAEAPITLAMCLEHTAGFDDMQFNEIFAPTETMSVREALSLNARSRKIRWKPGTRHAYSNFGFSVAALAIEEATGEPFDVYIRREILAPMGITDADFQRSGTLRERLATGYFEPGQPVVFRPFAHRAPASLLASANDLAKLIHFWIVRGDGFPPIISKQSLDRIEHGGTLPYPKTTAEYGLANYVDVHAPVLSHGHDGGMPGFQSSYRYIPDLGVGYAMLLNAPYTFRGYLEIRALIFAYLTRGRTFPPPETALSGDKPGASYFKPGSPANGIFEFVNRIHGGWRVTPVDNGQYVITNLQGESLRLFPMPDGGYRQPWQFFSSTRFTSQPDGTPHMIMGWGYTETGSEWAARTRFAAFRIATSMLMLAPLWAILELLLGLLWRRRYLPRSLILWPAAAGICCHAIWPLIGTAFFKGVIGQVHPLTVGVCVVTIGMAIASVATLYCSVRWLLRADRPPLYALIVPLAFGLAFTGYSLWLGVHGVIGMRTWSW